MAIIAIIAGVAALGAGALWYFTDPGDVNDCETAIEAGLAKAAADGPAAALMAFRGGLTGDSPLGEAPEGGESWSDGILRSITEARLDNAEARGPAAVACREDFEARLAAIYGPETTWSWRGGEVPKNEVPERIRLCKARCEELFPGGLGPAGRARRECKDNCRRGIQPSAPTAAPSEGMLARDGGPPGMVSGYQGVAQRGQMYSVAGNAGVSPGSSINPPPVGGVSAK